MTRRINAEGLALIKEFEGLKLTAYLCPANVWTIGYGSTGPHVRRGLTITEEEAERLLRNDLDRFERAVAASVKIHLNDNQFAACVSLAYNIGPAAFASSKLVKRLNEGRYEAAADRFPIHNKATVNGKKVVLNGLVRRRAHERNLFMTPAAPSLVPPVRPLPAPLPKVPANRPSLFAILKVLFGRS